MQVIDKVADKYVSLSAKQVSPKQMRTLSSQLAQDILKELRRQPTYAMDLSRKLKQNEQKVYYHIRKLEEAGIIEQIRKENVHGNLASIYALAANAVVCAFEDFRPARKIPGGETSELYFEPIIQNNEFNGLIIVGSPEPHGPMLAKSRDGYYSADLGLFLGTFITKVERLNVKLDTEVRSEDLQENLIIMGGPVVNMVMKKVNDELPVYFDEKKNWAIHSTVTGKYYYGDECGIIVKAKSPFNKKKTILVVAGKRYMGTRACTIAFIKHFEELVRGNRKNSAIHARVVQGLDRVGDGAIDDMQFLE